MSRMYQLVRNLVYHLADIDCTHAWAEDLIQVLTA